MTSHRSKCVSEQGNILTDFVQLKTGFRIRIHGDPGILPIEIFSNILYMLWKILKYFHIFFCFDHHIQWKKNQFCKYISGNKTKYTYNYIMISVLGPCYEKQEYFFVRLFRFYLESRIRIHSISTWICYSGNKVKRYVFWAEQIK